jgi:CheY-like chemotaxis protein
MMNALIVEDDMWVCKALTDLLRAIGYRTMIARDGASVLASLRVTQMPTVVLLDLMLPAMSGFALLSAPDADPALARHCAVVILTAHPEWGAQIAELRAKWTTRSTSHPSTQDSRRMVPGTPTSVLSCVLVKPASLRQLTRAIASAADHLAERSSSPADASCGTGVHDGDPQ